MPKVSLIASSCMHPGRRGLRPTVSLSHACAGAKRKRGREREGRKRSHMASPVPGPQVLYWLPSAQRSPPPSATLYCRGPAWATIALPLQHQNLPALGQPFAGSYFETHNAVQACRCQVSDDVQ